MAALRFVEFDLNWGSFHLHIKFKYGMQLINCTNKSLGNARDNSICVKYDDKRQTGDSSGVNT